MPANFKKRMLSDYTGSQTVTESEAETEENAPAKRLRISGRASALILEVQDISDASAAQTALTELRLQIQILSDNGVNVSIEDLLRTCEKLAELFHVFPTAELQSYILQTVGLLLSLPSGTACLPSLRSFFNTVLRDSSSTTVRLQLLRTLLEAGAVHKTNKAFCWHITAIVEKALARMATTNQPVLLAACLDLIGELFPFRDTSRKFVLRLWALFERSDAKEVRAAAYRMLTRLVSRGFLLDVNMYKRLCVALEDLSGDVRACAMELIFRLSQRHPSHQVPNQQADNQSTMNLVDDVFCKICDRVNDWLIPLRAQAATLLGRMEGVGMSYVLQTVDKKLMSDLRVKVAGHERQKQLFESGEWSSGRKWADDAPKERLQQDAVSLMHIGATGAFVLALEDEFQQVRQPAVISMAQLAARHPAFGQTCAEFLVDMFNDEIHAVRLAALQNFPLLGAGVELREDQLEMVLSVLQDAALDIRQGLRAILPTFRYSSAKLLRSVHTALLSNLRQYPADHAQICACLARLGAANGPLVKPDLGVYLNLHPYLQSTEPKADDRVYIATMALVCSAAVQAPEVFDSFLDFHLRHYLLYRYRYPEWFPVLESVGNTKLAVRLRQMSKSRREVTGGLDSLLATFGRSLSTVKSMKEMIDLSDVASQKIEEECAGDEQLTTTADWLQLQIRFLRGMAGILIEMEDSQGRGKWAKLFETSRPEKGQETVGDDLRGIVDQLRSRFAYHSPADLMHLLALSLRERLLQVVRKGVRQGDLVELGPGIEEEMSELVNGLQSSQQEVPAWVISLQEKAGGRVPLPTILSWLRHNLPLPTLPSPSLQALHCQISHPAAYNEYPVTMLAGTIHKIVFEAKVTGCPPAHLTELGVMVVMPDDKELLYRLTERDCLLEKDALLVKKEIGISQPVWTELAALTLQLVRILVGKTLSSSGAATCQLLQDDDRHKLLYLDTPVLYRLKTLPVRSNI